MIRNIGYACVNLTMNQGLKKKDQITTSRTLRMSNFSLERCGDLASKNAADLVKIMQWNVDNKIKMFRVSSEMFPFMDHMTIGYALRHLREDHQESITRNFTEAGRIAKAAGIRLSCHPGPYTCLASPNDDIVRKSIVSLEMHSLIGDLLGYGDEFAINIHMGGVYEGKHETAGRFLANFSKLPDHTKRRLTLENDDKASMWSMTDLLKQVAKYCTVKLVLDIHHHRFCRHESLEEAADMAFSTWQGFCEVPKVHYSESAPNKKPQAHSDFIKERIPNLGDTVYDVMIEAKAKDLALLEYRSIIGQTL